MRRFGLALFALPVLGLVSCSSSKSDDGGGACTDCAEAPHAPASGTLPDGGVAPNPTELSVAIEPVQLVLRQGVSADVTVTVSRPVGYAEPLAIQVDGAPANVMVTAGTVPGDKTQASFRVSVAGAAPQGSFTLDVKAVGATRNASTRLPLSITGAPGAIDTTFGSGGRGVGETDVLVTGMGVQPDGKIVLGGYAGTTTHDFVAVRFGATGAPDAAFGGGTGKAVMDFGGDEYSQALLVQHDGKITMAGYTYTPAAYGMAFTRFDGDGNVDSAFGGGGNGRLVLAPAQYQIVYGLSQQPDGKLLGAGIRYNSVDYDFTVVRLTAQGTLDTGFGGGGYAAIQMGNHDYCLGVTVDAQGRIIGTGERYNGAGYDLVTARFTSGGGLDTSFSAPAGWTASVAGGAALAYAWQPLVQPDGKILVAGTVPGATAQDLGVLRYNDDGTLDPSFGTAGHAAVDLAAYERIYRIALDSQNRIVYVGHISANNAVDATTKAVVGRLLPNGTPDTSFGTHGHVILDYTPGAEVGIGVSIQGDGRIVVAGYSVDAAKYVPWVTRIWN